MRTLLALLVCAFALVAKADTNTNCVTLTWDKSPDDTGGTNQQYILHHSTDLSVPKTNWVAVATAPAGTTNATIAELPAVHYFYITFAVFAPDGWGESDPSNVVSTPAKTAPPGNLNIRIGP